MDPRALAKLMAEFAAALGRPPEFLVFDAADGEFPVEVVREYDALMERLGVL